MQYEGVLTKMETECLHPIQYYLTFDTGFLHMNQLLGKSVTMVHQGYKCLTCGSEKKIFRQGCCYNCFMSSATVGDWIIKPELSTAHLDIEDRDLEYEKKVQLQPHVVYLALSSDVKVGVTRKTQLPTRWIDQGAVQAIPIVEVPNRYLAGVTEVALKKHYADKTNWQKMLKNQISDANLITEREVAFTLLPDEVKPYFMPEPPEVCYLEYPVATYPDKVTSLSLDKQPEFTGVLVGIKGQYLLFDNNFVFNVRNHEGYKVIFTL